MTKEQLKELIEFLELQVETAEKVTLSEFKLGRDDDRTVWSWAGRECCAKDILRMIDRIKDDKEH